MDTQFTPPPLDRNLGALPAELHAPSAQAPHKLSPPRRTVPILDTDPDDADDGYLQPGAFFTP